LKIHSYPLVHVQVITGTGAPKQREIT